MTTTTAHYKRTKLGIRRRPAILTASEYASVWARAAQLIGRRVHTPFGVGTLTVCWDGVPRVRVTLRCSASDWYVSEQASRRCRRTHRVYLDVVSGRLEPRSLWWAAFSTHGTQRTVSNWSLRSVVTKIWRCPNHTLYP